MKITGFTLTKEEAISALLRYVEGKGIDIDIDIDKEWTIVQQDDGEIDCICDNQ